MSRVRVGILLMLLLLPLVAFSQRYNPRESRGVEANICDALERGEPEKELPILPAPMPVDSLLTPDIPFTSMAVSMHGYGKKYNQVHETFILRNETHNYHISRVVVRLRYVGKGGTPIADRNEIVECDMAPGDTVSIKIRCFDNSKHYYYHKTPPRKEQGTPFKLEYDIVRYDVVVEE